jgi:hypothetical protein
MMGGGRENGEEARKLMQKEALYAQGKSIGHGM